MSFPARCCAFVRSGIFAPARVLKKHSSCRFLDYIGKSCLMREITTSEPAALPRNDSTETREITTSHSVSAPRNNEPYPTTSRLSSLLVMARLVFAAALFLCLAKIGEARAETWNCGQQNSNGEYINSVTCTYDEANKLRVV